MLNLARLDAAYVSLAFLDKVPSQALQEDKTLYLQPFVLLFQFDVDLFTFRTSLLEHEPSHWDSHDFPELKKGKEKNISFSSVTKKSIPMRKSLPRSLPCSHALNQEQNSVI